MMYTPSPPSKRPRPPSSAAHIRMRKTSLTAATSQPLGAMGLSSMDSDRTLIDGSGPSTSIGELAEQQLAADGTSKMAMAGKVTASPESEAAEVSFTLDGLPNRTLSATSSRRALRPAPLALGTIARSGGIAPAQASPPPPYGQDLPNAHTDSGNERDAPSGKVGRGGTPPCQDSGHPSRQTSNTPSMGGENDPQSEERQRQRRAADAARAMGLDIDFGMSSAASASGDESEDMTGSQVKQQLRDAKHKLKQRDRELVTAAQVAQRVLERYEALVSRLSSDARRRLPSFMDVLASQTTASSKSRSGSTPTPRPSHQRQASNRSIMSVESIMSPTSPLSLDGRCLSPDTMSPPLKPTGLRTLRMVEGLSMTARPRRVGLSKRTVRSSDPPLEQELYYAQLQQADMDARIGELEAALAEAQEGQEAQRRAAARLRRENELVHRNLASAEGLLGESSTLRGMPLPSNRATRPRVNVRMDERERTRRGERRRSTSGSRTRSDNGSDQHTRRNSFVEDFIDSIANRQSFTSLSDPSAGGNKQATSRSRSTSPMPSDHSPPSRSTIKLSAQSHRTNSQVTPHLIEPRKVRKKVSPSAFLSPARAAPLTGSTASQSPSAKRIITPQVKVDPPESEPPSPFRIRRLSHKSSRSSLSSVRSQRERLSPVPRPWSPAGSITSMTGLASRLSASPGYTSVSSRMASMRQYVAEHLQTARTLGSELGSDWGGPSPASLRVSPVHDRSLYHGDMAGHDHADGYAESRDGEEAEWEDENEYIPDEEVAYLESILSDAEAGGQSEEEGEGEEGRWPASSPAMLPPQISAALSSMAAAMGSGGIIGHNLWSQQKQGLVRTAHEGLPRRHSQTSSRSRKLKVQMRGDVDEWVDLHPTPTKAAKNGLLVRAGSTIGSRSPLLSLRKGQSRFARSPGPLLLRRLKGKGENIGEVGGDEGDLFSPQNVASGGQAPSRQIGWGVDRINASAAASRIRTRPRITPKARPALDDQDSSSRAHVYETHADGNTTDNDDWKEPRTIPGRLVHDLFVWVIIALEWTVYVFVLLIKMGLDLQEGKQGIM